MAALTRDDFQKLAATRLEDAHALLNNGRYSAAYYLVGYSVECALKACIAKQTKEFEFPDQKRVNDSWTHKLDKLLGLTQIPFSADFGNDDDLKANWLHVSNKWSESVRYDEREEQESRLIVAAVDDSAHGVMQWLQRHW